MIGRQGPLRPPARHGKGLEGPPCPQRVEDPDFPRARWRMCFLCGRVTRRLDDDGLPWCGGQLPICTFGHDWSQWWMASDARYYRRCQRGCGAPLQSRPADD